MDVIAEFEALQERSSRLRDFDAGIHAKLRSVLGAQWQFEADERKQDVLTQRQRDWEMLRYFHESMANSGDLFGYLGMIYDDPKPFQVIGATKTLKAANALRVLYDQQQLLSTQDEKDAFWHQSQEQRQPIELEADSLHEFADLLIAFAEAHPDEFSSVPAGDPFDNLNAYLSTLKEQIREKKT